MVVSKIGITERGDAALDLSWQKWVREQKRPAILITKDPLKLSEHLDKTDNVIVHATITGYGGTKLEPNVPNFGSAVRGISQLYKQLDKQRHRIVLRVDPIIPTVKGVSTARDVLLYVDNTFPGKWSNRVRISFLDNYHHVRQRFQQAGIKELPYNLHASIIDRQCAISLLVSKISCELEVCGEPEIECIGCVSEKDCKILGVEPAKGKSSQRSACMCLSNKHELLNNKQPCKHMCLYCYWK